MPGADQQDAGQGRATRSPPNEVRALSALAFDELSRFPGAIGEMHLGIAERAFDGVGPAASPVKAIHDTLSRRTYAAVGAGAAMLGRAADSAIERGAFGERRALSSTRSGSTLIGVLDGLLGDRLERDGSDLHQPPSLRRQGAQVELDQRSLREAFPAASTHIVVFLHGLMETELAWWWGAGDRTVAEDGVASSEEPGDDYGARLERDLGASSLYLRYNSGLHISESGCAIAALLERLVREWPTDVRQIALVGHSMGGLVARSACHQACEQDQQWVRRVRHVVSLGSPHLGAPLAQGAHVAAAALYKLPETRMLSQLLRRRSAGIRDLRHGSLVDEDWRGRDPHGLRAAACREVPLLPWATHCFVSATVTRDAAHPLGRLLGDLLVLAPSASGRGRTRRIPFDAEHGHHQGGAHHFTLLSHPEVYERLRGWLD
jgi:pimeloyl-ACP methyl ester carboxylesterase